MTSWSRLAFVRYILSFSMLLIAPALSGAQQLPLLAEEMAKTYGLDSWSEGQVRRDALLHPRS